MSEAADTPIFAAILKQDRPRFNAKFNAAKANAPAIDGAAFLAHLSARVAPLVEAIHERFPHRASSAADELYDLSLTLFSKNILGALPRVPPVAAAWEELFPSLVHAMGKEPKRIGGAICNALVQLHEAPGARAGQWMEEMKSLASQFFEESDDGEAFLSAGKIVAWRCGLAHFRSGALQTARELAQKNEPLARAALGLKGSSSSLESVIEDAVQNPWWTPQESSKENSEPYIAGVVGAFHGFAADKKLGAVFVSPPRVVFYEGNLFAVDSQNCWQVFADAFGASFHRAGPAEACPRGDSTSKWQLSAHGQVFSPEGSAQFDELESAGSFAAATNTLVATLPHSHSIFFVAL